MEWISVKTSMPSPLGNGFAISDIVLVLTEQKRPELGRYHIKRKRWIISGYGGNEAIPTITHWMELELPKNLE